VTHRFDVERKYMNPTALEAYASLQFPPDELHGPDCNYQKKGSSRISAAQLFVRGSFLRPLEFCIPRTQGSLCWLELNLCFRPGVLILIRHFPVCRFVIELVKAVVDRVGAGKTGEPSNPAPLSQFLIGPPEICCSCMRAFTSKVLLK
jgi:hypothetical protein